MKAASIWLTTRHTPCHSRRCDGTDTGRKADTTYFYASFHTLKLPNAQWRVLGDAHRKRNLAEYEGDVEIDGTLLEAVLRVTNDVAKQVEKLGPLPA